MSMWHEIVIIIISVPDYTAAFYNIISHLVCYALDVECKITFCSTQIFSGVKPLRNGLIFPRLKFLYLILETPAKSSFSFWDSFGSTPVKAAKPVRHHSDSSAFDDDDEKVRNSVTCDCYTQLRSMFSELTVFLF